MADIARLVLSTIFSGPADAAANAKIVIKHHWKAGFDKEGNLIALESDGEFIPTVDAKVKTGGAG